MKKSIITQIAGRSELIQQFRGYLRFEKRFSEGAAKKDGIILGQFVLFLMGYPSSLSDITSAEIGQLLLSVNVKNVRDYLAFLGTEQNSKGTIANKLGAVRSFYKFLVKRGRLSSNPAMAVKPPKREKKPPRFLKYEEVKRLLEAPSRDNLLGARDRAILETLYSTGMRVSEIVALNMDDIDFLGEVVHIRPAGNRERIAPISSSALQVIQHYMESRNKRAQTELNFDTKLLFVNKDGKRLSTGAVRKMMKKHLKAVGLDISISPITLRHSFAIHMIDNGADLRSIQELLGHQNLSMANTYERALRQKSKASCI